ncbi:MAG: hypothetical protein ACK47B_15440 [Armatimonadota bacterium]
MRTLLLSLTTLALAGAAAVAAGELSAQTASSPVREALEGYVRAVRAAAAEQDLDARSRLRSEVDDLVAVLARSVDAADVPELLRVLEEVGESAPGGGNLVRLAQRHGSEAKYVPVFVRMLRRDPAPHRWRGPLLRAVESSSHPDAVALLLEGLRDPDASPDLRRSAFNHLVATGGGAGLRAVRAARGGREPRRPWYERIDPEQLGESKRLAVRADRRGRTWMLFHDPVLGDRDDLFVVERQGLGWGRPLFTGEKRSYFARAPRPLDLLKPLPEPSFPDDWIDRFSENREIRADQDRDGLTDLVERRFGTDPRSPDTDRDGMVDAVDPCPNAAPRQLGDSEKIVAAALEALFFAREPGLPALLHVENMAPFEMYGFPDTLLWERPDRKHSLRRFKNYGNYLIGVGPPDRSIYPELIELNAARDRARVQVGWSFTVRHGSSYVVTLRKIEGDWYVIDSSEG